MILEDLVCFWSLSTAASLKTIPTRITCMPMTRTEEDYFFALESRDDLILNELRGLCLVGKYLYVVNANMQQNSVLCYEGSGTSYKYVSTFASSETCKGILHPFDLAFDGLDYCYLSSQDTNVVTRLITSKDGRRETQPR